MRQAKINAVAAFAKRYMLTDEEEKEILDLWFSEDEVPQYRIAQMLEKECFAGKIKWQTLPLSQHKTFECDEVIRALAPLLELEFFDDEEVPHEDDGEYFCDR